MGAVAAVQHKGSAALEALQAPDKGAGQEQRKHDDADRKDGNRVTLAAVALGAAGTVADDALEQGSAEKVASIGGDGQRGGRVYGRAGVRRFVEQDGSVGE